MFRLVGTAASRRAIVVSESVVWVCRGCGIFVGFSRGNRIIFLRCSVLVIALNWETRDEESGGKDEGKEVEELHFKWMFVRSG